MFKKIAHPSVDYVITLENTHIYWDKNLEIDVPFPNGTMSIDGQKLHKQLKATLLQSVPTYMEEKGNFLVAALTIVASNGDSAKSFTQPIQVIVDNTFYEECFTDSADFDVKLELVKKHINQRLRVAKAFKGICLPVNYYPKNDNKVLWQMYHSEQALIEHLWKKQSQNNLMEAFWQSGLYDFKHIEAIILDLHSKQTPCEFCEPSLFSIQAPKHEDGWLHTFKDTLKWGGFTIPEDGLRMVTRITSDVTFPRNEMKDILPKQTALISRDCRTFNNQIIIANDLKDVKCEDATTFSCTVFRSGSVKTREYKSPVKRRRNNSKRKKTRNIGFEICSKETGNKR